MFETSDSEHARAFLQEQMAHTQARIARLEHAQETCRSCDEAEGLAVMRSAVQMEANLLEELSHHMAYASVELDTLLVQQIEHYQQDVDQFSHGWQRGQPTPKGYWAAEGKVVFLKGLLRSFHARRSGSPLTREGITRI